MNSAEVPIYEQIMNQIKAAILSGELEEGDVLPSVRNLARDLNCSVITTRKAYEGLEAEGVYNQYGGEVGLLWRRRIWSFCGKTGLRKLKGSLQISWNTQGP